MQAATEHSMLANVSPLTHTHGHSPVCMPCCQHACPLLALHSRLHSSRNSVQGAAPLLSLVHEGKKEGRPTWRALVVEKGTGGCCLCAASTPVLREGRAAGVSKMAGGKKGSNALDITPAALPAAPPVPRLLRSLLPTQLHLPCHSMVVLLPLLSLPLLSCASSLVALPPLMPLALHWSQRSSQASQMGCCPCAFWQECLPAAARACARPWQHQTRRSPQAQQIPLAR